MAVELYSPSAYFPFAAYQPRNRTLSGVEINYYHDGKEYSGGRGGTPHVFVGNSEGDIVVYDDSGWRFNKENADITNRQEILNFMHLHHEAFMDFWNGIIDHDTLTNYFKDLEKVIFSTDGTNVVDFKETIIDAGYKKVLTAINIAMQKGGIWCGVNRNYFVKFTGKGRFLKY